MPPMTKRVESKSRSRLMMRLLSRGRSPSGPSSASVMRTAFRPWQTPALARNRATPSIDTTAGLSAAVSVAMMSPTRRSANSASAMGVSASVTRTSASAPAAGRVMGAGTGDDNWSSRRSSIRTGRQNRTPPHSSPIARRKATRITGSSAGRARSNRGSLSVCNTSKRKSSTLVHAARHSWRNKRTMRACQAPLDLGQRPLRGRSIVAGAAQQAVDHRVQDRRLDVEHHPIVQPIGLENVEAGRRLDVIGELPVGKLIDAAERHVDGCAQQGGQGRAETPRQTLVQRAQSLPLRQARCAAGWGRRGWSVGPSVDRSAIPSPVRCRTRRTCSWSTR